MLREKIAMRCTYQQFDEIKDILESHGFSIRKIDNFDIYPYLVNNFGYANYKISNLKKEHFLNTDRNIYENWNSNKFLWACGISETN